VEATPEPAPVESVEAGQPRDESGRFAPKTVEAPQAEAAPTQQQPEAVTTEAKDEAQVPSWRHRELREERDALRRQAEEASRQSYATQQQMAEMRRQLQSLQAPKQEPVDFFADPDKAIGQRLSPMQEQFNQMQAELRMETSRALNVARHGWDAVNEVEKAVGDAMQANDPSINLLRSQLQTSRDPVGTAMTWYSNSKLQKETGGNLTAYRDKLLADAMKDPAFQAKVIEAARTSANGAAGTSSAPNIKLPPSLNKTAGSGVTSAELDSEDMSDRALFKQAVNTRR
jgi:hypothetical protein